MAKNNNKSEPVKEWQMPEEQKKYKYILNWIEESIEARRAQNDFVNRAVRAYQGKPSANRYKGVINSYVSEVAKNDNIKSQAIKEACSDVPDKSSMVVHNAVETIVSMTQGGVGQYEFAPFDSNEQASDKLMDRLSAASKFFYQKEKVDAVVPQWIRNVVLGGSGYLHLKHDKKTKKKKITIVDTSEMLLDPKRFKTNCERFKGFAQRESFSVYKDKTKKVNGQYVLETINEAEVYVGQIVNELNSTLDVDSRGTYQNDALRRDLDIFYKPVITRINESRKNNPSHMYRGDEIEVAYIYDKMEDMYFEVINRRYIVVAKESDLKRTLEIPYLDYENVDKNGEPKEKKHKKTITLDDPFVELAFIKTFWDAYPISPLFYLLDDYDDLCAWESILYHNLSIMAPLTFVGQSSDAEKVSRIASVSGEVVEGLPQTFGVLDKTHDITPVVTMIQRIEEKIKRTMKAVDPFELQAMIGDRASAKEVSAMSGQIAQGVNPFVANIETAMAELGDKFFKMEIIYGDDTFSFPYDGKYAELTREQLAADYDVVAKLRSSIKLEQEANARRAIELIQFLNGNEAINQQQFLGTLIPIALNSLVTREQATNMVNEEYRPMPEEVIAAIKRRAEEDAKKDDIDKLDLSSYTPEELDELIMQQTSMGAGLAENPLVPEAAIDPVTGMPIDMGGVDPETGMPITQADPMGGAVVEPLPEEVPMGPSIGASLPGTPEGGGEAFNDSGGAGYVL